MRKGCHLQECEENNYPKPCSDFNIQCLHRNRKKNRFQHNSKHSTSRAQTRECKRLQHSKMTQKSIEICEFT